MLLHKQLSSVPKVTAKYVYVFLQTANSFNRRMNDITQRSVATKPVKGQAFPRTWQAAGDFYSDDQGNGWAKSQGTEPKRLFRHLVFGTSEPRPAPNSGEDAQRIDDEMAGYNRAVIELTKLQSNMETIISAAKDRSEVLANTLKYLERTGLTLSDVERLSVIHVAGTKGKGSTCALTESILRHYGAKTGFFSSPHLVSTNERIRINGDPLAPAKFTHYFWQVYNKLRMRQENERDMPAFFMFLTILGLHVFISEGVDVVVLEVGIGGELDCTNILRNVRTVGITSLAIEHTHLLGNTLREIAWQKAGIIKTGSHVYTHVTQPECLQVIQERADERQARLIQVRSTEEQFASRQCSDFLSNCNDYVRLNGSLAIQLAYDWLIQTEGLLHRDYEINRQEIDNKVLCGLSQANWPGRCQLVEYANMRVHLDGAHTVESMRVCCDWFQKSTIQSDSTNPRILFFNRTGESDTKAILLVLQELKRPFDMICFVPNLATTKPSNPSQMTVRYSDKAQRDRAQSIADTWEQLCIANDLTNNGKMYDTVWAAFEAVHTRYPRNLQLDVLITGSIHLLGVAIVVLDEFPLNDHEQCNREDEGEASLAELSMPTNGHT